MSYSPEVKMSTQLSMVVDVSDGPEIVGIEFKVCALLPIVPFHKAPQFALRATQHRGTEISSRLQLLGFETLRKTHLWRTHYLVLPAVPTKERIAVVFGRYALRFLVHPIHQERRWWQRRVPPTEYALSFEDWSTVNHRDRPPVPETELLRQASVYVATNLFHTDGIMPDYLIDPELDS